MGRPNQNKKLYEEPLFEDIRILEEGSAQEKPGTRLLKISGTASKGGVINGNNRLYPTEVLTAAVQKAQDALRKGKFLGRLDHPEGGNGGLRGTAMKFTKLWMEGTELKFEADVLATESGKELKVLLESGVGVGMSTRGYGSTVLKKTADGVEYHEVSMDFELKGIDAVLEESNPYGKITRYEEGLEDMELTLESLKKDFADVAKAYADEIRSELAAETAQKIEEGIKEGIKAQKAKIMEEAKKEVMESEEIKNLKESVADLQAKLDAKTKEYDEVKAALDEATKKLEEVELKEKISAKIDEKVKGHRFEKQLRARLAECTSVEEVDARFDAEVQYIESIVGMTEVPAGTGQVNDESNDDTNELDEEKQIQRRLAGL